MRPASGSPFAALATAESVEPKPESDLHVRALIKKYESGSQPSSAGSHQPQPALKPHAAPPAPTSPSFQDSEVDTPMSHPIDRFSTESESFEPATGGPHTQVGAPPSSGQLHRTSGCWPWRVRMVHAHAVCACIVHSAWAGARLTGALRAGRGAGARA